MAPGKTIKVPLIGGGFALIDPCDAFLARQYEWRRGGTNNNYAASLVKNGKTVQTFYLHRVITGAGPGEIVDHVNGDGLDCRRANLRKVDGSENNANRSFTNGSTGYRGVAWHPHVNKFKAQIERNGVYRGPFRKTAEEAAHDADALLRGLYGDVATYNFPREGEREIKRLESKAA